MKHADVALISRIPLRRRIRPGFLGAVALMAVTFALMLPNASSAATYATQCTALDICYCVNTDYRDAINGNVARVRRSGLGSLS